MIRIGVLQLAYFAKSLIANKNFMIEFHLTKKKKNYWFLEMIIKNNYHITNAIGSDLIVFIKFKKKKIV